MDPEMAFLPLIVVFLCLARSIYAAKCSVMITDDHLKYLDEMMDSQLETTCSKKVKVVDEKQLKGYCYSEAIISHLYDLLQNLKFKPDSKSYNHTQQLISLYNLRVTNCMEEDFVRTEEISKCLRYIDLSPVQILERVKKSFIIFRDFEASDRTCLGEYSLCEDDYDHVTKDKQQDGRLNSNLFLVLIPSMLAILLLCGLLYLMYRNRILRQQLNRQVSELPELRPLHSGLEPV